MNVTLMECVLAFAAGVAGSAIGGTQTFVLTGLVGLISAVLATCGIDTAVFDAHVLNLIFLPAVIFNGAGFATAYAAKHHEIRGFETRPLAGIHRRCAGVSDGRTRCTFGVAVFLP